MLHLNNINLTSPSDTNSIEKKLNRRYILYYADAVYPLLIPTIIATIYDISTFDLVTINTLVIAIAFSKPGFIYSIYRSLLNYITKCSENFIDPENHIEMTELCFRTERRSSICRTSE